MASIIKSNLPSRGGRYCTAPPTFAVREEKGHPTRAVHAQPIVPVNIIEFQLYIHSLHFHKAKLCHFSGADDVDSFTDLPTEFIDVACTWTTGELFLPIDVHQVGRPLPTAVTALWQDLFVCELRSRSCHLQASSLRFCR